jgi:hypothetical protein
MLRLTILLSCRFHNAWMRPACALAVAGWLGSCQPHANTVSKHQASPSAVSPAAMSEFNALVRKGDYAGAIAFVEASTLPASEKDGVIGSLILDGLVDPSSTTRPSYPLAEGFTRMERAASAGRVQSIADLRGKFTTGINYEGKNSLLPPNSSLAECWTGVEAGRDKPSTCINMRQRLHIP